MHFMKHYILGCWIILAGFSSLIGQELSGSYEPGELIIQYEPIAASRQAAAGKNIKEEHSQFFIALQQQIKTPILEQKPVFSSLVDHMVEENLSEEQLLRQIRERNFSRRGIALSQIGQSESRQFSKTLRIKVAPEKLPQVWDQLQSDKRLLEEWGYRITDISLNEKLYLSSEPNDPLFSSQYAHALTGAAVAWAQERGSSDVVIGVIDSGIDLNHEDLVGNILPGRDFVNRTTLRSWQLIPGEDYTEIDDDPSDFEGHGTHVSGVIAARSENEKGLSGVCPECRIMPLRTFAAVRITMDRGNGVIDTVLDSQSNSAEFSDALSYAVDNGVDIVNMSFTSGSERLGTIFQNAMRLAQENEVLMISSAGNENTSIRQFPGAFDEIMTVASTDDRDRKSVFSNYGSWVDVSAPGDRVMSTGPVSQEGAEVMLTNVVVQDNRLEANSFNFSGFTSGSPLEAEISYVGFAREADVSNPAYDWDLTGKIALIERGDIGFREKVERVKSFGAIAAVIFNNEPGAFGGTLLNEQQDPIPVLAISQEDGQFLLNLIENATSGLPAMVQNEVLSNYSLVTGTSFSAPYVVGMAGLILANNPIISPEELRAKILASVDDIDGLNPGFEGQMGTGRVSLAKLFPEEIPTSRKEELPGNAIAVFPNPATDVLQVEVAKDLKLLTLQVLNPLGQIVARIALASLRDQQSPSLDISQLPVGWYIIQGETHEGMWYGKFLKQ